MRTVKAPPIDPFARLDFQARGARKVTTGRFPIFPRLGFADRQKTDFTCAEYGKVPLPLTKVSARHNRVDQLSL